MDKEKNEFERLAKEVRELRSSFAEFTQAWQDASRRFSEENTDRHAAYEAEVAARNAAYAEKVRESDRERRKQTRRYDRRYALNMILTLWFLIASILVIDWISKHP